MIRSSGKSRRIPGGCPFNPPAFFSNKIKYLYKIPEDWRIYHLFYARKEKNKGNIYIGSKWGLHPPVLRDFMLINLKSNKFKQL